MATRAEESRGEQSRAEQSRGEHLTPGRVKDEEGCKEGKGLVERREELGRSNGWLSLHH